MSLNHDLSDLFGTLAAIMEIKGENPFKAMAFTKVSRILKDATFDVKSLVEEQKLDEVEGIGASSQKIIEEYVRTGRSTDFDEVAASVPAGLIPLLEIPGLGPKTIALFWRERGITSLPQLVEALDSGKLADLKGIGEKKLEGIRHGIALRARASQRMGIVEAQPIAEALLHRLRQLPQVKHAEIDGSLRRRRETIGDVDLLCAPRDESAGQEISDAFVKFPEVMKINAQGSTKASIVTAGGLQVDLRIVPEANFGAALLYFTGSKDHNVKLRGMAQDKGMMLNEWGIYKAGVRGEGSGASEKEVGKPPSAKAIASKTEVEVYKSLGLPFIPPELREDRGEIDAALAGRLPVLIDAEDIRGDLHCHTTASDGIASIEEMAQRAIDLGYEYLAITDHSKSQVIANGLNADRLLKHAENIRRIGQQFRSIRLLAGCEVDILADGHLDFEDAVLKELDFVVASPHVALKQDSQKATARLLRAIENPYVNVIGHPTGRLINSRDGLPLDFGRIFQAAHESGTALEINAGWPRLDLDEVNARAAAERGVLLSINTDAHNVDHLLEIDWGIAVARRGWVRKNSVINCLSFKALQEFIARKRR